MKSRTQIALIASAIVLVASTLSACSNPTPQTDSSGSDTIEIAWFSPSSTNTYLAADLKGIQEAADEAGAKVNTFDAKFDATTQVGQMQDALLQDKYDIFVVSPLNPAAVVPVAQQAIDQGVQVISLVSTIGTDVDSLDSDVDGVITVGMQLSKAGIAVGGLMVEACAEKNPCRVAYMPGDASQAADQVRTQALKAVLAKHANIELVAEQPAGFDVATGLATTQNILTANAELDVIAAASSQPIAGAVQAIAQAGREGDIMVVSAGGTVEDIQGIKDGTIFGALLSLPFTEGKLGTEAALKALNGERVETSIDLFENSPIGSSTITKSTLESDEGGSFEGEWTVG